MIVKELGDKYPFGDDEILRIARCLTYLRHTSVALSDEIVSNTFLSNWAVYCSTLPVADFSNGNNSESPYLNLLKVDVNLVKNMNDNNDDEEVITVNKTRMKIRKVMKFIESEILPNNFGQTLEETFFALLAPVDNGNSMANDIENNEFSSSMDDLAMQRLCKFLNGLADSSRRGSRKSLSVIYNCCIASETSNIDGNRSNVHVKASAKSLLDLTYRLSLASVLLGRNMNECHEKTCSDEDDYGEDDNDDEDKGTQAVKSDDSRDEKDHNEIDFSVYIPKEIDPSVIQSLVEFESKHSTQHSSNHLSSYSYQNDASSLSSDTAYTKGQVDDDDDKGKVMISFEAFTAWVEANVPCLAATLETFIHYIFFPDKPYPPSRLEFLFPFLRGQYSAFFQSESSPMLFTFCAMSPSLGGAWHRLYTSDEDGLSFNRLQNALLGYGGPTLLIIKESQGDGIFGAYTSTAWKESKDFYGNSDCFLFQLQPCLRVILPRGRGANNFMYCNSESRSRGYDGQAHGIGFGGTIEKPRLFIAESFDGCMASASDLTFEAGALLPLLNTDDKTVDLPSNRKYFDIACIEVWGVGGDELVRKALGAQNSQREIKAANIRKARKVDKAAFLDDLRSGLIESKAFKVCCHNFILSIAMKKLLYSKKILIYVCFFNYYARLVASRGNERSRRLPY